MANLQLPIPDGTQNPCPTSLGALAEYINVRADHLAPTPPNITPTQAAGLSLAGQTAWMGLFEYDDLQPGQTVFINGASSSVGAYAIQIAKSRGLKVWASASGKNEDFVRGLGADEVSRKFSLLRALTLE